MQTIARTIQENDGAASAGELRPLVIEWRCAEHFENTELYPVSNFMNRLLGFGADESPSARFERLARYLERLRFGFARERWSAFLPNSSSCRRMIVIRQLA